MEEELVEDWAGEEEVVGEEESPPGRKSRWDLGAAAASADFCSEGGAAKGCERGGGYGGCGGRVG